MTIASRLRRRAALWLCPELAEAEAGVAPGWNGNDPRCLLDQYGKGEVRMYCRACGDYINVAGPKACPSPLRQRAGSRSDTQ